MAQQEKRVLGIRYGALSDPITKQLRDQGYKYIKKEVDRFDELKIYTTHLRFAGLLPDAEFDRVLKRLHKQVVKHVVEQNPLTP